MKTLTRTCALLCALTLGGPLPAQTAPAQDNPPPALSAADRAWLDVRAAAFTPDFSAQMPAEPAARKAALIERAKVFVRTAERAKSFYTQHPEHSKTNEAKLVAVRALVAATQGGDATVEGELTSLVQAWRADPSIPASYRVQVVSAYAFPKAMRNATNREGRLAAAAQVARSLAVEFPGQPQGYTSLLGVAQSSNDAKYVVLVREVADSTAPAAVKAQAHALLRRQALLNQSLAGMLTGTKADALQAGLQSNRPTIIYTWASGNQSSIALAQYLAGRDLAKVNVVGLNLDTDVVAAQLLATQQHLPGSQHFDPLGSAGLLAVRLEVHATAGLVYLANAQGNLVDLRGQFGLEGKLTALGL